MSRSSSVSTKDKAGQSKRPKPAKQRRDDSDSFDVRSQYTPFFPQQPVQGPTWAPAPQYAPMGPQQPFNGVVQNNYQNPMPPQFVPSAQQFNPVMMNNGNMQPYNSMPQVSKICYEVRVPWLTKYSNILSNPKHDSSHIVLQSLHTALQSNRRQLLPSNGNNHQSTRVHTNPIPGSYNRHAFNPKTQSFVPGNTGLPVPQPMSHHGSHHGSPHHGSPHFNYNAFSPPQQQYSNGMGYSMTRQGSNNSLPSYHASPHMAHRSMMHQGMPQGMPQGVPQGVPHGMAPQNLPQGMHGMPQNGQVGNHLPNYGNPSTLPPKPPTGV